MNAEPMFSAEVEARDASRLWVCHGCQMIGSEAEATAHRIVRGHHVEELSQETSDGIREQWVQERARRAVGFMEAARPLAEPQGEASKQSGVSDA